MTGIMTDVTLTCPPPLLARLPSSGMANPGSLSSGKASVKTRDVEVALQPKHRSWCKRHRGCLLACSCCCCVLLIAIGVIAYVFWPRMITVCAHYSQVEAVVRIEGDDGGASSSATVPGATGSTAAPSPTARVSMVIPIEINSTNLWGVRIDKLRVDAYYSGNRAAALSRGELDGFGLVPLGTTRFDVSLSSPDVEAAQASNAHGMHAVSTCGNAAFSVPTARRRVTVQIILFGAAARC